MKKIDLTDMTSNLLVLCAVMIAFVPFILGDQLVPITESAIRQSTIMFSEFSTLLLNMFS